MFKQEMKKTSFFACLLSVSMMYTSCASDDSDFDPTTVDEETQTVTFEGSYFDALIDALANYAFLAVPFSNGSKNFVVVFDNSSLMFADKQARVIKSMDVIGTTYALAVCKNGDGNDYAKALTQKGDFYDVIVTGFKAGEKTGDVTISIAKDGGFLTDWFKADMTPLGAVDSLAFSMDGSDKSNWGIKTPKYFAFDNVVIKK